MSRDRCRGQEWLMTRGYSMTALLRDVDGGETLRVWVYDGREEELSCIPTHESAGACSGAAISNFQADSAIEPRSCLRHPTLERRGADRSVTLVDSDDPATREAGSPVCGDRCRHGLKSEACS